MWLYLLPALVTLAAAQDTEYRLPTAVVPYHYDLRLLIDARPETNFTYYGIARILVRCDNATDRIVMHGKRFNIKEDSVKVSGADDTFEVKSAAIENTKLDLLVIALDRSMDKEENYTVVIPFYGNLDDDLEGAYISTYQNKTTGKKEYLVVTQFEAIYARKTFPCFDEPALKATFTVTLGHSRELNAISNMPLVSSLDTDTSEDNWLWDEMMKLKTSNQQTDIVWDKFDKSLPMSTYLLAFVISKFEYKQSPESLSNTTFKIWARSDAISQTEYASDIGPRILSFYEDYFRVPFPLPKQDMVAIPDFGAGAMENWGLITYRETALLYDPMESSLAAKERVAEVIAHELAHQWFGNLVTMKWWSDLWLNEGFATYVATVGVNHVEPKWKVLEQEAVANARIVMRLDALNSSHMVSVPIDDPNMISQIFDGISYSKGCMIIRMMVMFLTEDVFRKGINEYLTSHSYGNAEQDDLWASLTAAARDAGVLPHNASVKMVMDTWTRQTGYPILTVSRNYEDGAVNIKQKRYLALDPSTESPESWWVPLNMLTRSRTRSKTAWLQDNQGLQSEVQVDERVLATDWLLLNANMSAPYRVNYDLKNWMMLADALEKDFRAVPTLNRVQLLDDSFALAWTNLLQYQVPLEFISYLQKEKEYLPLDTAMQSLSKIGNVLKRSKDYGAFQKFVRKFITKTYEEAGGLFSKEIRNPEDPQSVMMQTLTSSWACKMKVPSCEANAIDLFDLWMQRDNPDEDNPIPVELRGIIYCQAIERGSVEHWAFLFQRYQRSNVPSAKTSMMTALACTREIWILKEYLEWTVDKGPEIRSQDGPTVIAAVLSSTVGYYVAKPFIYSRIEDIYNAFSSRRVGGVVKSLLGQITTQEELDELLAWRAKNEAYLSDAKQSIDQAVEHAMINVNWAQKNQEKVVEMMRKLAA